MLRNRRDRSSFWIVILSFYLGVSLPLWAKSDSLPMVKFVSLHQKSRLSITVEVPRTKRDFEQGLMFRKTLAKQHGMLFSYPKPQTVRFWMRNTYIPLDIVFLDEQKKIVWIEESAIPLDESPRGPNVQVQHVVEIEAGLCKKYHIRLGDRVQFNQVLETMLPLVHKTFLTENL